jgi:hypothetical protein
VLGRLVFPASVVLGRNDAPVDIKRSVNAFEQRIVICTGGFYRTSTALVSMIIAAVVRVVSAASYTAFEVAAAIEVATVVVATVASSTQSARNQMRDCVV